MMLSDLSIRRPVFAWMLMAGLLVFGGLCFRQLGISLMPDVDFPVVSISVGLLGAAPEVMETQVVDLIEDAVMEIQGIRTVNSTSRQGSASVSVEFELDRNIDAAVQEIQAHLARIQGMLPANVTPPTIRKSNPEDQPILWLTVTSDHTFTRPQLMAYARNVLFDQFSTIEGVGDINLGGYVDQNLRVWLSEPKLAALSLTVDDVLKSIAAEHVDLPAGRLENAEREANVRLMGEAANVAEFGKIRIEARGGGANFAPVPLSQVARIEEGLADVRRTSRLNGRLAVGLGILKQHGSNAVDVAKAVRAKIATVQAAMPPGLTLGIRMDSTEFIKQSVDELTFTLLLSALLTSVVCYLFLGSLTSTFNVLMAIPTSIVGACIALRLLGMTLNTFTMLGLSLAIGIVVDDAIMMLENIVRHGEMGKGRRRAALDGAREISFAAMAATVAVVAIFVPVVFMKGIVGRYLFHYGMTVTAAVCLSLLEAVTLTPMRSSRFLRVAKHRNLIERAMDGIMTRLTHGYGHVLRAALRWPWLTVALAIMALTPTFKLFKSLPSELTPAQDQARFMLRFKAPVGSSLEFTDGKIKIAESYLATVPEIKDVYSTVGGFGGDAVNEGMMFVSLKDKKDRQKSQKAVMDAARQELMQRLPGIKVIVQDLSLRGFSSSRGFPIEVSIQGPDWEKLGQLSAELMDKMSDSELMVDVNTDYQVGMPEVRIIPNREQAARHGVNLKTLATDINALLGGAVLGANTRYTKDNHRYDIRVRLEGQERHHASDLSHLHIRNNRGELIPLSKVLSVVDRPSLQLVARRNRQRSVAVFANIASGHAQDEALRAVEALGKEILPSGYKLELTGSAQTFRESFQSLILAMVLGIFVSYMVLASQFNSFIHPVSILVALPFSLGGALIALKIAGQSINMFSVIGLILLMGIVKKNSILLVDFANQLRSEGQALRPAILAACPVRLRPILMTSVATIAGALPAAMALGPGAETRVPMAVAIIGGVILSTLLTLVVVPAVYCLLAKFEAYKPLTDEA